jgi:hypothetical protein
MLDNSALLLYGKMEPSAGIEPTTSPLRPAGIRKRSVLPSNYEGIRGVGATGVEPAILGRETYFQSKRVYQFRHAPHKNTQYQRPSLFSILLLLFKRLSAVRTDASLKCGNAFTNSALLKP